MKKKNFLVTEQLFGHMAYIYRIEATSKEEAIEIFQSSVSGDFPEPVSKPEFIEHDTMPEYEVEEETPEPPKVKIESFTIDCSKDIDSQVKKLFKDGTLGD